MILARLKAYLNKSFNLREDKEDEAISRKEIIDAVSFRGANIVILILAIFIASLGLNTNSAAVIIGAMLVSPLMGPIIGIGLGIGTYDFPLIKRSFKNVARAALFSVLASTLYFLISPVGENSSEILARTSPTIYDVLIGFFGGAAGIVAISCKNRGNVIPGVAIATALMPPLCTAGYGLATWQLSYFFGAFYLFLINSIFIAFATTLGVKLFKFKPVEFVDQTKKKRIRNAVIGIAVITILPSIYLTFLMLRESYFVNQAKKFVDKEFVFTNTQVFSKEAYIEDWNKYINVKLIGEKVNIDSLQTSMTLKLKESGIGDVALKITQGFSTSSVISKMPTDGVMKDIYDLSMRKIDRQASTIDSLNTIIAHKHSFDSLSYSIAPEIKVLFPEITDIAVTQSLFCDVDGNSIDTTNIVLIEYKNGIKDFEKLKNYLEARTGLKNINIVRSKVREEIRAKEIEAKKAEEKAKMLEEKKK